MKKQLDEMENQIKLESQSLGFKVTVLLLAFWTMYEGISSIVRTQPRNILPCMILIVACVCQNISEQSLRHRMVDGDEEYKEPNKTFWTVIMIFVAMAVVISVGTLFLYI